MNNRKNNYYILIVDDEIEYQNVVSMILEDAGYQTAACSNGREALDFLAENQVDLVITDIRMPVMMGTELIKAMGEKGYDADILVVTAYGSIEGAIDSIRLGAADYFVKSSDLDELILKVNRIAEMKRLKNKTNILLKNRNHQDFFLHSQNPEYKEVLNICERTADTNINILLLGESGVGKEVVANYIHQISGRSNEPFIPVNCQVFPEGVIESELFGHEVGAFTGAVSSRVGKFEEANYGTLFLDEIGDLPMTTQGKLLRALETKCIERVGSNRRIHLDVRFLFATNRDLEKEIEKGTFREDLFYRINTLTLMIPPLRKRREDLPALIGFFIEKTEKDQKKMGVQVDDEVMEYLLRYDYPGNIRELKNIVERMIALSRNGRVTMNELLMPGGLREKPVSCAEEGMPLRNARYVFEKKYIADALEKSDWNVKKTSEALEITERQLWNKINQYGLTRH